MLYMPRGTVHQAVAQDGTSVHLTISTYQKWTWGDLVVTVMEHAMSVGTYNNIFLTLQPFLDFTRCHSIQTLQQHLSKNLIFSNAQLQYHHGIYLFQPALFEGPLCII